MLNVTNTLNSLIPISRFNKGEASKIFDEVKEKGCGIVVKNNIPACVLLSPEQYQELTEKLEDEYLYALAMERMANDTGKTYSLEEVMKMSGITIEDLEDYEDVEFE